MTEALAGAGVAVHDCPLHADIDLDALNAYERRYLAIACADLSFHEEVAQRARNQIKRARTRRDWRSMARHAFFRQQLVLIEKRAARIRAEMRRVIAREPAPTQVDHVDLWERN